MRTNRMGAKNVAPPIPEAMAVVATAKPTGNIYQYWAERLSSMAHRSSNGEKTLKSWRRMSSMNPRGSDC